MWHWSSDAGIRAVRAAILITGLFALTLEVIGNVQLATYTAFGGFATLVLASFGGTRRDKLVAHTAVALTGCVLIVIGTAVGGSAVLGAVVTVPVAFAVFFAGIAGPNAASAATATLLAYVLPAASSGPMSLIGDRLAGWMLASVAGTAAVLATSGKDRPHAIRSSAAQLANALADVLAAALANEIVDEGLAGALDAKHALLARFNSAPYSPIGLAAADEALGSAVKLLEWCTSIVADLVAERLDFAAAADADRELLAASASGLREVAGLLAGRPANPDLARIERTRTRSMASLLERSQHDGSLGAAGRIAFHANGIAVAVRTLGADALVATGVAGPEWFAQERRGVFGGSVAGVRVPRRVFRLAAVARRDASLRSVWLINSLRGAIALAAAVTVADLTSVQHGFWVVFGTLSVLRTNAASTGATAARALGGTALGFVIGGGLLVAIGTTSAALWATLPVAVLVTAYAPGTAPFAVGQAAFTVTVAVLFNLLVPIGWRVGVIRVEDVAIGCAVSIVVGSLLWPRGVGSLVGDDIADAFRSGAAYLRQAVGWALGRRTGRPENAVQAVDAGLRLGDALRGLLAEQGTKHISKPDLWRLVGGSMRLRLTAHAIAGLPHDAIGSEAARDVLQRRTETLESWYERLAEMVAAPRRGPVPELDVPRFAPEDIVDGSAGSPYGVWLCEHLDHLCAHCADLVQPAERVAAIRRRPWWR